MKRNRKLSLTKRRAVTGFLFVLPWFIGFLFIYVRSLWMTFRYAVSEMAMDVGGYTLKFTGLTNFTYAFFEHGYYKQYLVTSISNMLIDVPLITFFSLFMAMLLNKKFKGRGLVRAIFFLPIIMGGEAVTEAMALAEKMINGGVSQQVAEVTASTGGVLAFDIDYIINMFVNLGLPVKMLDYVFQAVSRINDIIRASGVQIILFIAALQSIPGAMYEVARIEGATTYETFWKVTFPMVMPHIITNVVYTIVDNFEDSSVIQLAYDTAFTGTANYGLSAVFTLVSTMITLVILVIIVGILQKRTFYYN